MGQGTSKMSLNDDDSNGSVGAGLQALRNKLETLNFPGNGAQEKPDLRSAANAPAKNHVLAHYSYEMWLKSETRIPLKAYWAAFCLLCAVSYIGPPFLHAAWSVGLAWVIGEWRSRKQQQAAYQYGVEYGISAATARAVKAPQTAPSVDRKSASFGEGGHKSEVAESVSLKQTTY